MKRILRIPGTTSAPIRKHGGGFVAEGPGFYIWDEDLGEVLRVARDLEQGEPDLSPTTRLLVVRDDFERSSIA